MSVILGFGPPHDHDPSAVLLVDGKLSAAVEEERFIRQKHAHSQYPLNSIHYCLQQAKLKPTDIEHVAFAWNPKTYRRARWHYVSAMLSTNFYVARKRFMQVGRINRFRQRLVEETLIKTGIDPRKIKIHTPEHHIAHGASATLFSGFEETAFMSIDADGEFISTLIGEVKNGQMKKIHEIYTPHSLGLFYSTITEYLGFQSNDGEYKVMGMAPYGDPLKADLSFMIRKTSDGFKVNPNHVWVMDERKKFKKDKMYSKKMVEYLGPPRRDEGLTTPYIHIAAATQAILEDIVISLINRYLTDSLKKHGNLCLAGGCALNVKMNKKILEHPLIKNIFVQPAANDAGTSLGAAALIAYELGEKIEPMTHAYYGPEFTSEEIKNAIEEAGLPYQHCEDVTEMAAELLAQGHILGWFQGRMEFGPRGLGNRSILGNPTIKGTSDKINGLIKFREPWRPFCPSILEEYAKDIIGSTHPSPFMTLSFDVAPHWRFKIPEIVHVDGSARPQTVHRATNPRFYSLIENFRRKTGMPVVINTSLNRRGEPIVCTPQDALTTFLGCGLEHLFMGDFWIFKKHPT